jgi:acyl-lipid omega-6 desaturase (Delta-12 desaturase)
VAARSPVYLLTEQFSHPRVARSALEFVDTLVPYLGLTTAMMLLVKWGRPWLAVPVSLVASGFLVRVFIIFHDCCHGSFLPSRRANRIAGYVTGLLTLTPFEKWQRAHAEHHAGVGDLDRRGSGDVWTMTVAEYLAARRWKRLFYRAFRNPFVMLGIGPALVFVLDNRWPWSVTNRRERFSVHFTNAGIVAALVVAHLTIGLPIFLATLVPTQLLAGAMGVWLFYVQHQFEDVYWARRPAWEPVRAALEGSSYYKLPRVLEWMTGSIGLHHIHHVQPRIPFYRLRRCLAAVPTFQDVPPLTIRGSLRSARLRLVDEERRQMVTWADLAAELTGRAKPGSAAQEDPP